MILESGQGHSCLPVAIRLGGGFGYVENSRLRWSVPEEFKGVLQGLQGLDVAGEKSEISLFFSLSCNRNFKCQIKGFFTLKVLRLCQEMAWCWRVWVDFPDHGVPFQQAASRLLFQESFLHLHCKIFALLHCSGSLCFFLFFSKDSNIGSRLSVF